MDPPHVSYVDHHSILAINSKGKIKQLFVPFRVQVVQETDFLKVRSWVLVEEVQQHDHYLLLYRIANVWWPYYLFRLQVQF